MAGVVREEKESVLVTASSFGLEARKRCAAEVLAVPGAPTSSDAPPAACTRASSASSLAASAVGTDSAAKSGLGSAVGYLKAGTQEVQGFQPEARSRRATSKRVRVGDEEEVGLSSSSASPALLPSSPSLAGSPSVAGAREVSSLWNLARSLESRAPPRPHAAQKKKRREQASEEEEEDDEEDDDNERSSPAAAAAAAASQTPFPPPPNIVAIAPSRSLRSVAVAWTSVILMAGEGAGDGAGKEGREEEDEEEEEEADADDTKPPPPPPPTSNPSPRSHASAGGTTRSNRGSSAAASAGLFDASHELTSGLHPSSDPDR